MDEPPPKFTAEFVERRMREHKEFQERMAEALALEIIEELEGCGDKWT